MKAFAPQRLENGRSLMAGKTILEELSSYLWRINRGVACAPATRGLAANLVDEEILDVAGQKGTALWTVSAP